MVVLAYFATRTATLDLDLLLCSVFRFKGKFLFQQPNKGKGAEAVQQKRTCVISHKGDQQDHQELMISDSGGGEGETEQEQVIWRRRKIMEGGDKEGKAKERKR